MEGQGLKTVLEDPDLFACLIFFFISTLQSCSSKKHLHLQLPSRIELGFPCPYKILWASLGAQMVKNPPAMWETWV